MGNKQQEVQDRKRKDRRSRKRRPFKKKSIYKVERS